MSPVTFEQPAEAPVTASTELAVRYPVQSEVFSIATAVFTRAQEWSSDRICLQSAGLAPEVLNPLRQFTFENATGPSYWAGHS